MTLLLFSGGGDAPLEAGTLHVVGHIVAVEGAVAAGTLHVVAHINAAGSPMPVAGTLHIVRHLVPASMLVSAGTLHIVANIDHAIVKGEPLISAAVFSRQSVGIAPYAQLEHSFGRKWRDPLNEAGTGQLTMQNTDPDLSQCGFGRIVTFSHRDIPRWSMFVRRHDRMSRAPGEERDQVTVVSGVGIASALEEAVIYPQNGAGSIPFYDIRYFNFATPEYDDSAWITPTIVPDQPFHNPPWPTYTRARPTGFPNLTAVGLWSAPMPLDDAQPAAIGYFRGTCTVPGTDAVAVSIFMGGDDIYEVWVDGLLTFSSLDGTGQAWWNCQRADTFLSPGDHTIAVKVICGYPDANGNIVLAAMSWDPPLGHYNIGEILMAIYTVDPVLGIPQELLLETNTTDWVCLHDPDEPPGFTPGEIINILLDEAADRGTLTDVTRTWTNDVDSAGTAWPLTSDVTFRVGMNYYNACRQLTEGYLDFAFAPDALEMSLWVSRGDDVSATAQLAGGVNLGSLKHTSEG